MLFSFKSNDTNSYFVETCLVESSLVILSPVKFNKPLLYNFSNCDDIIKEKALEQHAEILLSIVPSSIQFSMHKFFTLLYVIF